MFLYIFFNYSLCLVLSVSSGRYSKMYFHHQFGSVQSLSHVRNFVTPWITAHQSSLSITNSQSLFKLMSIESVMPSNHLILCRPLLLLLPIPPSIRVFSNESILCMRWPKYWSFSFSISPSNEHPGLISFRMDWLDLLTLQGTLKSLLQHHSSKASIFQPSAFFTVQLSMHHRLGLFPFFRHYLFYNMYKVFKIWHISVRFWACSLIWYVSHVLFCYLPSDCI